MPSSSKAVWTGFLKFSLVAVPVRAYTAAVSGGGGISFNQLHKGCNSRIQQKKFCPVHGEIKTDEIVSGYEYSKGQYVVMEAEELEKFRTASDKSINIGAFVETTCLDARYYSGRSYYLTPDGPVAQKPYALLYKGMKDNDRYAFAQMVMHGKEHIVLIRPVEGLMVMSFLNYEEDLKSPAEFQGEVQKLEVSPAEMKLAKTLMDALDVRDFDFSQYHDKYVANVTKLIEAKVKGQEVVEVAAAPEQTQPIDLIEALQQSIEQAKARQAAAGAAAGKPPKQLAPSRAQAAAAAGAQKKRKTS